MIVIAHNHKPCSRCRVIKCGSRDPQRSDFYRRNSRSAQLRSVCKGCDRERRHEWDRQHPEVKRARQRAWLEAKRSDPERHAILADQQREHYRRTHGVTPDRYRRLRVPVVRDASGCVDVGPFAAWLLTLAPTVAAAARRVGMDKEQVAKYIAGKQRPMLDTVDRALLRAATATTLDDLYPHEPSHQEVA